jgi:hypothetical protein
MLTRPMVAVIMVALLFCGATVGLEAVGLLFHASIPDPQQRIDSYVARLEADLSPVDLPTEPVDIPSDVAEQTEGEARLATAVVPALDAVNTSEVPPKPGQAEPESRSGERITVATIDIAVQPDNLIAPRHALSDPYSPAAHEPAADPAPLLAVQASSPAPAETAAGDLLTQAPYDAAHEVAQRAPQEAARETALESAQESASDPSAPLLVVQASSPPPVAERPAAQRMARTHRARPVRGPIGYAAFGWPVLDWMTTW